MMDLLKMLCSLSGASGYEDDVRDYIETRARPFADTVETDAMGNLIVFKKGKMTPKRTLMLCAHMDEVGVIITGINGDGYLNFDFLGGVDRRVVIGKTVYVRSKLGGRVPGVFGLKPVHLSEKSEGIPKLDSMYIDIGTSTKEDAEKLVALGDDGVFSPDIVEFGEGLIKAKALDDRLGCAVLLKLIESDLPCDCRFVFTVQEEVGARGAAVAAYRLRPDIALVVEGTTAADLPDVPYDKQICQPGNGVVIPYMDRGALYDRTLWTVLADLADSDNLPRQTKRQIAGGTDAQTIQRSGVGVRTVGIAAAIRNIHSPSSIANVADIEGVLTLSRLFLQAVADGTVDAAIEGSSFPKAAEIADDSNE